MPSVRRSGRVAFRDHFARIEKVALKAVIACVLLGRRAAVAVDDKVFVALVSVVHIVPAECVQIDLRYAFGNGDLV